MNVEVVGFKPANVEIITDIATFMAKKLDIDFDFKIIAESCSGSIGRIDLTDDLPQVFISKDYERFKILGKSPTNPHIKDPYYRITSTMGHELTHLKQKMTKGLKLVHFKNNEDWFIVEYDNVEYKYFSNPTKNISWWISDYYDLPFEKEAFINQDKLMFSYMGENPSKPYNLVCDENQYKLLIV